METTIIHYDDQLMLNNMQLINLYMLCMKYVHVMLINMDDVDE